MAAAAALAASAQAGGYPPGRGRSAGCAEGRGALHLGCARPCARSRAPPAHLLHQRLRLAGTEDFHHMLERIKLGVGVLLPDLRQLGVHLEPQVVSHTSQRFRVAVGRSWRGARSRAQTGAMGNGQWATAARSCGWASTELLGCACRQVVPVARRARHTRAGLYGARDGCCQGAHTTIPGHTLGVAARSTVPATHPHVAAPEHTKAGACYIMRGATHHPTAGKPRHRRWATNG